MAIELLINSANMKFGSSFYLLSLASIIEFGTDIENIKNGLNKFKFMSNELLTKICQIIQTNNFNDLDIFEKNFIYYRDVIYAYINFFFPIELKYIINSTKKQKKSSTNSKKENINKFFYEGFGLD